MNKGRVTGHAVKGGWGVVANSRPATITAETCPVFTGPPGWLSPEQTHDRQRPQQGGLREEAGG